MCGIIGIIGTSDAAQRLVEGLRRLEYRGYDSAGVATLVNGRIERCRAEGKLKNLDRKLQAEPLAGTIGIGHTRWATHGGPTENNAHPHATEKCAVVHNGIIENYKALKAELQERGHPFATETDTEVIVHLVTDLLDRGLDLAKSVIEAKSVVVKPSHVGSPTLVTLTVDQPLYAWVGESHHSAFTRCHLLVRIEAEYRRMTAATNPNPV